METTEATFNTGILNDILSGKPEKQLPALQKVITLAKNGKEIKPHWLKIINASLNSKSTDVHRIGYETLRYSELSLSQWETLIPLVFRDLCSLDLDCRLSVLRGLPSVPLELIVSKELKSPGQIWIGGTKDEPVGVHLAALAALNSMIFKKEFFRMEGLVKDSWDFVVDRVTDRSACTLCPALAIVGNLFAYASGFRKYEDAEVDLIAPIAARVVDDLIPHLSWIVEQVVLLPDLAKTPCLYAITCLMINILNQSDENVLENRILINETTKSTDTKQSKRKKMVDKPKSLSKSDIISIVQEHFIPWLDNPDPLLVFQTARCILVIAENLPAEGQQWSITATTALLNLVRPYSVLNKDIFTAILPLIPTTNEKFAAQILAAMVQLAFEFPAQEARAKMLTKIFIHALEKGRKPLAKPSVMENFFKQTPIMMLWNIEDNRIWTEELIGCMINELSSNIDDCVESGIAFLSLTKDCLTWDFKNRLFIVSYWMRYAHKLLLKVEKSSGIPPATAAAMAKLLRDFGADTIPEITNTKVLIQAVYLLVKHTPKADLAGGSPFVNSISNKIKAVFLRADDLEALRKEANPSAAHATLDGYVTPLERATLDKELAIKGIKCLVTLASRESIYAPPLAHYIGEYAQYFAHDRPFQAKVEQLARTAASFAKGARNLGQQDPRLYINGCELAARPLFSRDDDALWLSIRKAHQATHALNGLERKWSSPKTLSAQSDMVLVKMSHSLNPSAKNININVSITNITNTPSMGGIIHFSMSPQATAWTQKDTAGFNSAEILRAEPQGMQNVTFAVSASAFGDIEITPHLTIAIPQHADSIEAKREAEKERRRKQEDFRRALGSLSSDGEGAATTTSAAAAVAAKESSAQTAAARTGATTTVAVQEKAVDEGWRSRWPDVRMDTYVIRAEEMVVPLPMPEDEFSAIVWMRLHAADIVYYRVDRCAPEMEIGIVDDRMRTYGVYSVSRRAWGGGKCFEGAYTFASWFDNVFALKLFVFEKGAKEEEKKFYVRVEFRASSERSLKVLCGNKLTKLLDTVFAGSAVRVDESNFHVLLN